MPRYAKARFINSWPILRARLERPLRLFDLDNGAGRIRGIYADGILRGGRDFPSWFAPFRKMEAKTVPNADDGGRT